MAVGLDLNARHGAIHSIGQIGLSLVTSGVQVDNSVLDTIAQIEPTVSLFEKGGFCFVCELLDSWKMVKLFTEHLIQHFDKNANWFQIKCGI